MNPFECPTKSVTLFLGLLEVKTSEKMWHADQSKRAVSRLKSHRGRIDRRGTIFQRSLYDDVNMRPWLVDRDENEYFERN
jgi:hypothetical protein